MRQEELQMTEKYTVGGGGREAWNQQGPSTVGGKENAHDRGLQQATAVKKIACFF